MRLQVSSGKDVDFIVEVKDEEEVKEEENSGENFLFK